MEAYERITNVAITGMVAANSVAAYRFVEIVNEICTCQNRTDLKARMGKLSSKYNDWQYDYGFDHYNMYVSRNDTSQTIISVDFRQ